MLMLTKDVLFNLHQCSFSGSWSWDDQFPENEYWTEQQVLFSLKSALIFWYLTFEEAIKTQVLTLVETQELYELKSDLVKFCSKSVNI